nr:putative late blight resistance protein homolog R1B-16 isoform X1 [Ipomoea batatas]
MNVIEKLPFYKRISQHLFSEPCRWISYRPGSSFLWLDNQIRSNWLNKSHSIHSSALHFRDMKHLFSHFKLLRVLDIEIVFGEGHDNALNVLANLVHLRYLALSTCEDAFSFDVKLFEHWNMQSFIVRSCAGILDCSQASQIWKMSLLRNFYVRACFSLETSEVIHRNLQTIFWLDRKCCTNDLFKRIPNLKKLGIRGGVSSGNPDYFYNLFQLGQLEKLSIRGWHPKGILCNGIQWETNFLPTLKKLIFKGTGLPWCDMRFIGMLPNLEVLKLINACEGPKWEPSEGGFRRLKMLVIEEVFLNCWNAVGDHFPVLECLELRKCYWLLEIPSGFVDITTLALIQLKSCEDCLLASAKRIQDEQHSYGNHALLGPEPTMLYNEGWYEAWIMMADFRNAEKPLNLVEAHGWWTFLNLHRKVVSASEKKLLLQFILLYRKKLNR